MEDTQLLTLLNRTNPWWHDEPVHGSLKKANYRRRDYYIHERMLIEDGRQVISLRGPRQVGKTTLVGQLIEYLIQRRGLPPERVLYLLFENSRILSEPEGKVEQALDVYRDSILQTDFRNVDGTVYVFIDEVQNSPDWADTLKYYCDVYESIQFFVTGSIGQLIRQDAGDSLVGRVDDNVILPMKFADQVEYRIGADHRELTTTSVELRDSLKSALMEDDRLAFTGPVGTFVGTNDHLRPEFNGVLREYLLKGGYPGVLDESVDTAYRHLDQDLQNTVLRDLGGVFDVEEPRRVLGVLSLLADSVGSKINKSNIAEAAGIHRNTVADYLRYLEQFFLISECPKYSKSEYQRRSRPKVYIQDVGVYNTLAGTMSDRTLEESDRMGPILETAVADHCRRLQFHLSDQQNAQIYYWDSPGEIDFILHGSDYLLPIEVKHGDPRNRDLSALHRFIDDQPTAFGLCVNNADVFAEEGDILMIPAWIFLFLC